MIGAGRRVLFVDDDADRATWLKKLLEDCWIEVRLSPDAVKRRDVEWCEFLVLDHDMCRGGRCGTKLSATIYAPLCTCPTGNDLVRRMVDEDWPRRPALIHSVNRRAAEIMRRALCAWQVNALVRPIDEWGLHAQPQSMKQWLAAVESRQAAGAHAPELLGGPLQDRTRRSILWGRS